MDRPSGVPSPNLHLTGSPPREKGRWRQDSLRVENGLREKEENEPVEPEDV